MVELRSKNEPGEPSSGGTEARERLARLVGRLVLWGCVLLLLLRGIASVLAGPPSSAPARTVMTVTQPAPGAPAGRLGGEGRVR
jgi:hypothetical protein